MIDNLLFWSGLLLSIPLSAQINTEVQIFQPQVISNGQTFGITISPDGSTAYFVNSCGGRQQLEIMQSEKKNGKWSVPTPAFFSQKGMREIDPFISPDGNTILYNSRRGTADNKEKDLDIWMLKKQNGKWSQPFPVDAVNTSEQETYATMASSGNIYFGVTKDGGYGGGDIYVSKFENGKYQTPTNVGFPINTDKDEGNCFIAADESYMILSANGYSSNFGGFDLYISFNNNGKWSIPINLGNKINTADNDFCPLIAQKDILYFSRSRKEGEKLIENIYYTTLNIPLLKAMSGMQTAPVLNSAFPDGDAYGITFSPDEQIVYTTRSNEARTVCEVYSLQRNTIGSFSNPQKIDAWNITANVSNPVVSHDGSFALLRISSPGKNPDLYISRKDINGNWQKPTALPRHINTEIDQYYPELTAENHLYYSSNGDVFFSEYKDGDWQEPKPVKELNTSFSESNIAVSRDGKFLVFLSDRTG
ncbi:MAG: PD40 domain-containing protein, partial [Chitinophagaceae bacterium]|nr:PD40 domain-containing protein [Chitinophagaceae bacterium]